MVFIHVAAHVDVSSSQEEAQKWLSLAEKLLKTVLPGDWAWGSRPLGSPGYTLELLVQKVGSDD